MPQCVSQVVPNARSVETHLRHIPAAAWGCGSYGKIFGLIHKGHEETPAIFVPFVDNIELAFLPDG
jgi:hypothetical protein